MSSNDVEDDAKTPKLEPLKQALIAASIEIYRHEDTELAIAERVRVHLMDSGVRVRTEQGRLVVAFTARTQRSDFPNLSADDLFARVRSAIEGAASPRGYTEMNAVITSVTDPMDESRVLDTWHEVTYARPTSADEDVVDEVRWALALDKYVTP